MCICQTPSVPMAGSNDNVCRGGDRVMLDGISFADSGSVVFA
jgi:hypothetical protein